MADLRVTTTSGTDAVLNETRIEEFSTSLRGGLLRTGDEGYDESRSVWNAMIDRKPALIARCAGAADVINCVNFARDNNLLVAVRGGGHNVAGYGVCDGGIVIDLSLMKGLRIDPEKRVAHAEPGLTWGEYDHDTQAFGLATPGGQISTTGVAGVTLGGGWGWLSRKYGLTSDNLLSVDVVTADGSFLKASPNQNSDLFWGIRGGGGNFGIVTSFEFKLHQVGPIVFGGLIAYPFTQAREVFELYREMTSTAPNELASDLVMMTLPDDTEVAAIALCYNGPTEKGEEIVRPLRGFGPPLMDMIGLIPFTEVQKMLDPFYPTGLHDYWKSSFMMEISDNAVDTFIEHCTNRPTPLCQGLMEHQLGGATSQGGELESAFGHRDVELSFLALGVCEDSSEEEACIRWARDFWEAMQPYAAEGVYVNYLGQQVDEGEERVKAAYGSGKYQRLVALKNKYDPTNLFRLNQNIKPNSPSRPTP